MTHTRVLNSAPHFRLREPTLTDSTFVITQGVSIRTVPTFGAAAFVPALAISIIVACTPPPVYNAGAIGTPVDAGPTVTYSFALTIAATTQPPITWTSMLYLSNSIPTNIVPPSCQNLTTCGVSFTVPPQYPNPAVESIQVCVTSANFLFTCKTLGLNPSAPTVPVDTRNPSAPGTWGSGEYGVNIAPIPCTYSVAGQAASGNGGPDYTIAIACTCSSGMNGSYATPIYGGTSIEACGTDGPCPDAGSVPNTCMMDPVYTYVGEYQNPFDNNYFLSRMLVGTAATWIDGGGIGIEEASGASSGTFDFIASGYAISGNCNGGDGCSIAGTVSEDLSTITFTDQWPDGGVGTGTFTRQ